MFARTLALGICVFAFSGAAQAGPAKVLHQTQGSVMVRLGADDSHVVWQNVGDDGSEHYLYELNTRNGQKTQLKAPKRPFAPSVSGGYLIFGAGHLNEKIDIILTSLDSGKSYRLHKLVPWIPEPAIQVRNGRIEATWERSEDDSGNGLAIYRWTGTPDGRGEFKILADGPVQRRDDIPREYWRLVHNEYPRVDGDAVVFQNNEYGSPNIYRLDTATGKVARIAPSQLYQERPWVSGPYTVWEESESGFASSDTSDIYVHDMRTGQVRKLNAMRGFHYQARVFGDLAIYGAKREPLAHTPSLRVYDLSSNVEINAQKCFPGAVYDWAPVKAGLYVAQRFNQSSSRLLFATWDQIRAGCK